MSARRRASGRTALPQRSRSAPEPPFSRSRASARPTTPRRRSGRPPSRRSRACRWPGRRSWQSAGRRASPPRSAARSRRASRSGSPRPPMRCLHLSASPARAGRHDRWTCSTSAPTPRSPPRSGPPARPESRDSPLPSAFRATAGSASTPSSPSSRRGLPLRTPARAARAPSRGVVAGAVADGAQLVRNAFAGPSRRTSTSASPTDRTVLAEGPGGATIAHGAASAAGPGASRSHPPPPRPRPGGAWRSPDSR